MPKKISIGLLTSMTELKYGVCLFQNTCIALFKLVYELLFYIVCLLLDSSPEMDSFSGFKVSQCCHNIAYELIIYINFKITG